MGLFTGVLNYIKGGFKFLEPVLPKKQNTSQMPSKSITSTTDMKTHKQQDDNDNDDADHDDHDDHDDDDDHSLFPKKIIIDKEAFKGSSAVACSTNKPSKLVKVEHLDGSVAWSFDHNETGATVGNMTSMSNMTSPFLTSTGSTVSGGFSPMINMNMFQTQKDSPSPLAMEQQQKHNHNKGSDVDSANSIDDHMMKIPDLPNPEFFDIGDDEGEVDGEGEDVSGEESDASIDQKTGKKKKKSYTCEFCGAEFRIRGYLTRHIKKHALNKAYECPFFDEHSENKCHPNGGFSRRDTYKTHLKARHFKYPPGTRSQDRAITAGKCGLCNKPYESNEDWVERHIEGGECEALPKGYTGRVKNSRRKNYEYPNPQQISPISSNSGNDSPMTSKSSPHTLVMPQNGGVGSMSHHHLPMQDSISGNIHIGVANMTPGSIGTPIHSRPGSAEGGSTVMNNNTNNTTTTDHIEMNPFKFNNNVVQFNNFNDYDNNDEYSLDVEQCVSFTPMPIQSGYSY